MYNQTKVIHVLYHVYNIEETSIFRGRKFIWDHLRMEDVSCYWLKLLKKYAKLQSFKPTRDKSFKQIKS